MQGTNTVNGQAKKVTTIILSLSDEIGSLANILKWLKVTFNCFNFTLLTSDSFDELPLNLRATQEASRLIMPGNKVPNKIVILIAKELLL